MTEFPFVKTRQRDFSTKRHFGSGGELSPVFRPQAALCKMGVWVGEEGKVGGNWQSEGMKRTEEEREQRRGDERLEVKGADPEERGGRTEMIGGDGQ